MTADELYVIIKNLVVGLESIGFKVIAVITDNNAINRKAVSKFVLSSKIINCIPSPFELNSTVIFSLRHSSSFEMCSE